MATRCGQNVLEVKKITSSLSQKPVSADWAELHVGVRVTTEVSYFVVDGVFDGPTERETFPRDGALDWENFRQSIRHGRPSKESPNYFCRLTRHARNARGWDFSPVPTHPHKKFDPSSQTAAYFLSTKGGKYDHHSGNNKNTPQHSFKC